MRTLCKECLDEEGCVEILTVATFGEKTCSECHKTIKDNEIYTVRDKVSIRFMEDEEFDEWWASPETQEAYTNFSKKDFAQYAWQASLELFRSVECDDCSLKNKLCACRPAINCIKTNKNIDGPHTY